MDACVLSRRPVLVGQLLRFHELFAFFEICICAFASQPHPAGYRLHCYLIGCLGACECKKKKALNLHHVLTVGLLLVNSLQELMKLVRNEPPFKRLKGYVFLKTP